LKALVEIQLHLDTFRNIDLFYQGLYFIKLKVLSRTNSSQNWEALQPCWHFQTLKQEQRLEKMKKQADQHNLMPSSID